MVGRKKKVTAPAEEPVDLSRRIGARDPAVELSPVRRLDGPIDSATRPRPVADLAPRAARKGDRPAMIGLDEAPMASAAPAPARAPEVTAPSRPTMIGLEESLAPAPPRPAILEDEPASEPALVSVREAPAFGEIDLVATPLPTPDDWHHFELALRKLRGIGELRTEYYRAGVLKVRVRWSGADRFANAVRAVPGYRVRVLGEDRNTVQVLIGRR